MKILLNICDFSSFISPPRKKSRKRRISSSTCYKNPEHIRRIFSETGDTRMFSLYVEAKLLNFTLVPCIVRDDVQSLNRCRDLCSQEVKTLLTQSSKVSISSCEAVKWQISSFICVFL